MRTRLMISFLVADASTAVGTGTRGATTNDEGVALTIYNQNFGVVRERRTVNVEEKVGTIRFSDVAAQIDGTSVQFKSITDPDASV